MALKFASRLLRVIVSSILLKWVEGCDHYAPKFLSVVAYSLDSALSSPLSPSSSPPLLSSSSSSSSSLSSSEDDAEDFVNIAKGTHAQACFKL